MDQFGDVRFSAVIQFLLDHYHYIVLLHAVPREAWVHSCIVEALETGDAKEEERD